jgi:hypothetical protein
MTPTNLIANWQSRIGRMKDAHYTAATVLQRGHFYLGLPATIASTFVGATVFTSLATSTYWPVQIAAGLLSLAAGVLVALQTFLRHSERAEQHRLAGSNYGTLKSEIELLATFTPDDPTQLCARLDSLRRHWDEIRERSPAIPPRLAKRFGLTPAVSRLPSNSGDVTQQ